MIEKYNDIYSSSAEYAKHYKEVVYYPIWLYVVCKINCNEKVLDLGCGPSHLGQMMYQIGFRYYTGIDYSSIAIQMAKARNLPFEYIEKDLFEVNYSKYKKHLIVATETFEHLDDLKLLKMLPKNNIIISVPNFMSETHERTYDSPEQIREYYSGVIDIKTIKTFQMNETNKIFAITGKII